jgi:SAM-dependent methyltransferase
MTPEQMDAYYTPHIGTRYTDELADMLRHISRAASVLEVGCNCGNQLGALESLGFRNLWGCDCAEFALDIGREIHPNVNFIHAESDRLPFANGSFDLVFTAWTLACMDSGLSAHAQSEIMRVSRAWVMGFEPWSEQLAFVKGRRFAPYAARYGWPVVRTRSYNNADGERADLFLCAKPNWMRV